MLDSSFASEMMAAFLDEVEDQLQTMDQDILRLEQSGESGETIQSLFRAAHTLKGSSAAMGFEEMKLLTHEMEHILDRVRNHRVGVTHAMTNLLFKCLDRLRMLKDEFMAGTGLFTEINPIVHELQSFAADAQDQPAAEIVERLPDFFRVEASELRLKIREAQDQGFRVLDVRVALIPDCLMRSARALIISHRLGLWGEVLQAAPSFEALEEDIGASAAELRFLLAGHAEPLLVEEDLLSMMDVSHVQVSPYVPEDAGDEAGNEAKNEAGNEAENEAEDEAEDEAENEAEDEAENEAENEAEAAAFALTARPEPDGKRAIAEAVKRKAQTIRVDVERLELLMNLVGELVIDQTRISQVGNVLHRRYASDESVGELGQISDHVSRVIGELQESVMKVRMLPIEQLFNRFPRMVRDLAQSLHKEVELIIEGRETELDRTVIEEIGDPLIHLIRNAIDHGIEPAAERKRAGKPVVGQLQMIAAHEENQVVITVEDDGAGIDPDRIKRSALLKGIISEEECGKLTEQEAIHLIFRPGFSTASAVSDISGRGVGMDIVRNHIEKLNGVIDIETERGKGTRFKIKLPLTLAIITGLLIKLNDRTFIVPMSSVVEIVRMPPEAIQTIKGDSVVVIREQVLNVVWLHDHFQMPRPQQAGKQLPIIVAGTAEKRIALVVDELVGNQEIVVKSLGAFVGKVRGISGATILGDGRVALILEIAGIGKPDVRLGAPQ